MLKGGAAHEAWQLRVHGEHGVGRHYYYAVPLRLVPVFGYTVYAVLRRNTRCLAQHGKTFDDLFVIFQVVLLIFGVFFLALSPIWIIVIFASGSYNYMVEEESYMFIIFIVATAVEILISFFMVMPHLRKKIRFVDKTLKMFEK